MTKGQYQNCWYKKAAFWTVHNINIGYLAPWLLGIVIGKKPHKIKGANKHKRQRSNK